MKDSSLRPSRPPRTFGMATTGRGDASCWYYDYDGLERLTDAVWKDSADATLYGYHYEYDKVGNRTKLVADGVATYYAYNDANELTKHWTPGAENVYYAYDGRGNCAEREVLDGHTLYFAHDSRNLLAAISSTDPGFTPNYFLYNGLGQRVQKIDGTGTTRFIWDGLNITHELDGSDTTVRRYTHGHAAVHGVGSLIDVYDASAGTTYFYHGDPAGGIRRLTDGGGAVARTYEYSPFGRLLADAGAAPNALVFPATYHTLPDLPDLRHSPTRLYDAATGRFLQRDTTGTAGAGNPYAGFLNCPVDCTDPDGTVIFVPVGKGLPDARKRAEQIRDQILELAKDKAVLGGVNLRDAIRLREAAKDPETQRARGMVLEVVGLDRATLKQVLVSVFGPGARNRAPQVLVQGLRNTWLYMQANSPRADRPYGAKCLLAALVDEHFYRYVVIDRYLPERQDIRLTTGHRRGAPAEYGQNRIALRGDDVYWVNPAVMGFWKIGTIIRDDEVKDPAKRRVWLHLPPYTKKRPMEVRLDQLRDIVEAYSVTPASPPIEQGSDALRNDWILNAIRRGLGLMPGPSGPEREATPESWRSDDVIRIDDSGNVYWVVRRALTPQETLIGKRLEKGRAAFPPFSIKPLLMMERSVWRRPRSLRDLEDRESVQTIYLGRLVGDEVYLLDHWFTRDMRTRLRAALTIRYDRLVKVAAQYPKQHTEPLNKMVNDQQREQAISGMLIRELAYGGVTRGPSFEEQIAGALPPVPLWPGAALRIVGGAALTYLGFLSAPLPPLAVYLVASGADEMGTGLYELFSGQTSQTNTTRLLQLIPGISREGAHWIKLGLDITASIAAMRAIRAGGATPAQGRGYSWDASMVPESPRALPDIERLERVYQAVHNRPLILWTTRLRRKVAGTHFFTGQIRIHPHRWAALTSAQQATILFEELGHHVGIMARPLWWRLGHYVLYRSLGWAQLLEELRAHSYALRGFWPTWRYAVRHTTIAIRLGTGGIPILPGTLRLTGEAALAYYGLAYAVDELLFAPRRRRPR